MHYRIGSRGSKLALAQTETVKNEMEKAYPEDSFEIVIIKTQGDLVQNKALHEIGSKGLFTVEIEQQLLDGRIDLAVHSMKDMPGGMTAGLTFAKAWKREDPRDALILREAASLEELPPGAVIGTGSLRRQKQLLLLRPDLRTVNIRGNIDTRLRKMEELKLDGIILAAAGLRRLGLEDRITRTFTTEEMIPAPAQGILAIQTRSDNRELLEKLNALSDPVSDLQARAERKWLEAVGADCHMPVGAYCQVREDGSLSLSTVYGTGADAPLFFGSAEAPAEQAQAAEQINRRPALQREQAAERINPRAAAWSEQTAGQIAVQAAAQVRRDAEQTRFGTVYLIGAGPGDPDLLTLRGQEILKQADCVIYDRLIGRELLDLAPACAEKIYAGKADHHHTLPQSRINELLYEKAKEYRTVVRLKGGDPYVFGRGGEEGLYLNARGIRWEEVPGISSAIAGLACAGIPITHRGIATGFHVITAHDKRNRMTDIDFAALQNPKDTLVFLMGLSKVAEIADGLIRAGRDPKTPAAVISNASTPQQRTCTGSLDTIADRVQEAGLISPALVVVGDVVSLREGLSQAESRPLFGKHYLVAKVGREPSRLTLMLREQGADVREIMTGQIRYCRGLLPEKALPQMDWIIFSSKHGVKSFFDDLREQKIDLRSFGKTRFAVVGKKTAEALQEHGIYADLIPEKENGKALADALKAIVGPEEEVWYFKAETASDALIKTLSGCCRLHAVTAYVNEAYVNEAFLQDRPADPDEGEAAGDTEAAKVSEKPEFDGAFFSCASAVERLLDENGVRKLQNVKIYAIGPSTRAALEARGVTGVRMPDQASLEALAEMVISGRED